MKAVIYARYSSDNQREESIEGQLRECTAYCEKNDITVLRTYIDRAMSAKTDHRPDFQRMIKDSAKSLFDVIIVWKLDRFARNRYDSAHYKAQLRKYGVKVLSATENISDGPEGIILESMLEGMAEYYSAELSEKVIRGHTENALKSKYNGGTPTFGYVIDKDMQYQIDPRTAPAVLEMFTMYDEGATMKEIVAYMSERGVTTVRGKKIDLNFMARLLKNRKYIGEYSYEDNRGAFEAADGHTLLRYLEAAHFGAVTWKIVPGTTYEEAILGKVDTTTPEYKAFREKVYADALHSMGLGSLLKRADKKEKEVEHER